VGRLTGRRDEPMGRRNTLPATPVTAAIDSLSHEGRGVARHNGKTMFVDNALPGEEVLARIVRRHGRFDEAVAVEVITASASRVPPPCAHFGVCGGCSLQHLVPAAQVEHKQAMLMEQFRHVGKVEPEAVMPAILGPTGGYRRRARLGVRLVAKKGGVLVGFREKSSRYIADVQRCVVLDPRVGDHLIEMRRVIGALSCPDQIPQIEVGVDDHGPILTLRHLQPLTEADRVLLGDAADANGWRVYLQPGGIDSVTPLRAEQREPCFSAPRHGVRLFFEPLDFIQVNAAINLAAIDRVIELLALTPGDRVLDLFCGLGNFTLPIARYAGEVVGVEGEAGLVARANLNAERNGMANVRFLQADLTRQSIPGTQFNKLLLDPPRTGAIEVLRSLELKPFERVVYVSCNPATLARDADVLVHEHGFRLVSAGVMDMFPHTAHVESIALFLR
jgi:23S rRNA (uracil1939-C5)-methyltransferase